MQKIVLTALGALAGLTVAIVTEKGEKKQDLLFEKTFGVPPSKYPYLLEDSEIVDLLYPLAKYRQHGESIFQVLLQNFDRICAFYQNALDTENSTSRMGDVITVGSLRVTLIMTLRNYVKLVLYHTQRDIKVKQEVMRSVDKLCNLVDGMRDEMGTLVEKRVYERQQRAKAKSDVGLGKKRKAPPTKSKDVEKKKSPAKDEVTPAPPPTPEHPKAGSQ